MAQGILCGPPVRSPQSIPFHAASRRERYAMSIEILAVVAMAAIMLEILRVVLGNYRGRGH